LLEQAHQRAAELDDRWLQAVSGHELCNLFTYTGDYDLALQSGQQTLLLAEELGEPRRRMITSYYLASLHIRLDDLALARDYLERAQRLAQETGDIRYQAHVLRVRTDYYLARGDVNAAAEDAARALEFSQRIGDPMVLFAGQINAGRVEQWAGNLLDAAHYFMQAYRLGRQYGLFSMQTNALLYLAETAWKYGSHAEAAALAVRLEPEVQADLELARIAARLRQAAQERFTPEFLEKLAAEAGQASLEALLGRLSLAA
jgi:tetratricopeptide (TPR) repeat protein